MMLISAGGCEGVSCSRDPHPVTAWLAHSAELVPCLKAAHDIMALQTHQLWPGKRQAFASLAAHIGKVEGLVAPESLLHCRVAEAEPEGVLLCLRQRCLRCSQALWQGLQGAERR